jgi:peptide/histidine transporter 3/4
MGIGILLSTISMAALAIAESFRRTTAIKEGFPDNPNAELHISAMWLLPYFVLSGLAEAFNAIGQNEFFYTELPKSMSSVASTLQGLGLSAASLVSSFIVSAVRDFTKGEAQESWVSSNINKGHYDYYYWLLTILSLVNFIYYLVCSKTYGPCRQEKWFNR